jgi:hypothetical protein
VKDKLFENYKKLVTDFYFEVEKLYGDKTDILNQIPSIQIPGFGINYPTSPRKILYLGIDNRGWDSILDVLNSRKEDQNFIKTEIEGTCSVLENMTFIKWFKEQTKDNIKTSPFWNVLIKIHLSLKNVKFNDPIQVDDILYIKDHLMDFSWGNTHSIMVYNSYLKNYKPKNGEIQLAKTDYQNIQKLTKPFDNLELMVETLSPDVVIIMNGGTWENINYKDFLSSFQIQKDSSTKQWEKYLNKSRDITLFWLNHPRANNFGKHERIIKYLKTELDVS